MNKLFQASVINIMFIISLQASSLSELPEIKYESFKLDNGLTVIVHEDKKVPMVAVNVWYHVGSKNEKLGKTGFAHLFEHLMFNGTENYNNEYFEPFEKIGSTDQNGTTNSATTTENSSLNKSTTASNNQGKSRKSGSQNNTVSNQKTGTLLNYSDRHSGLNTQNIPRITATNMTGTGTEGSGLLNAQVEIPDEKDARFCVLSYDQVKRLNDLMSEVINVHGLGNWATIDVRLSDLVAVVKSKLEADGIKVHEIRLNGSGASSVLASSDINYNDLDLIFSVDLSTAKAFDRVKTACLQSLTELLPEGVCRKKMSSCRLEEAFLWEPLSVL